MHFSKTVKSFFDKFYVFGRRFVESGSILDFNVFADSWDPEDFENGLNNPVEHIYIELSTNWARIEHELVRGQKFTENLRKIYGKSTENLRNNLRKIYGKKLFTEYIFKNLRKIHLIIYGKFTEKISTSYHYMI